MTNDLLATRMGLPRSLKFVFFSDLVLWLILFALAMICWVVCSCLWRCLVVKAFNNLERGRPALAAADADSSNIGGLREHAHRNTAGVERTRVADGKT